MTGQRFCTSCGATLDAGARFCGECGSSVRAADAPPPSAGQPAPPSAERPTPPSDAGRTAPPRTPEPVSAAAPPPPPPRAAAPSSPFEQPAEVAAPWRSPYPAEPRPGFETPPVYASILQRFLGVVVDALVGLGVFVLAGTLVANQTDDTTRNGFNLEGQPALVAIGISTLATFAYYILMEALFGATLGKFVAGIRVRSVAGGPITPVAALLRNLLRVVDGIGGYLVGGIVASSSPRRQRLGDRVADTVVVPAARPAMARWLALGAAILVAAAGIGGCNVLRDPAEEEQVAAVTSPTRAPATQAATAARTATTGAAATARATGSPAATARTTASPAATARVTASPATPTRPGGAVFTAGPLTVTMAQDITDDYDPLDPTTVFSPTSDPIYAAFSANGAGANARLRSVWIATNVGSAAPRDAVLDEATLTLPRGNESGAFNLSQTGRPWPVGEYRVEFYLNGNLVLSVPFTVR